MIDFDGKKFHRCPHALIKEAQYRDGHLACYAMATWDLRASEPQSEQPAWLIDAWRVITCERNRLEAYLIKHPPGE